MNWKNERKPLLIIVILFITAYFLPVEKPELINAVKESLILLKWYAREHVLLCLVPAFFIAGVISVFISQNAVIKYLGAQAKKVTAYLVASLSGSILAVCSCTILPLFASIYQRGAGLGPAVAFLYSGPAINILAIILTARILGFELGIARIVGAVVFSIVIGLLMHIIFIKEEREKEKLQAVVINSENDQNIWKTVFHMFTLIAILIFVNWGKPTESVGAWFQIYSHKWMITGIFGILFAVSLVYVLKIKKILVIAITIMTVLISILTNNPLVPFIFAVIGLSIILSFDNGEAGEWMTSTWVFAKQIMPLLAIGVLAAGFLLGSPGSEGIINSKWIIMFVGKNTFFSNFFASFIGAFMYFATLTEIPILQGLIAGGMAKGPALALLLAGPALSLPNMLVINSVMGIKKTSVFITLVILMSTLTGLVFGIFF